MNEKSPSLQDLFLNSLREEKISIAVYLTNGIRLIGHIEAFDAYAVLLKAGSISQLLYKHAIVTMVPTSEVNLHGNDNVGNRIEAPQPSKRTPVIVKKKLREPA